MRNGARAAIITTFFALALANSASAAETVGSNLLADPGTGPAPNVGFVQTVQPTGVTMPLTATASGVIVSISVRHGTSGANPGVYGFRVLSGTSPNFTATGAPAALPDFNWPANDTPGTRVFIPISGGAPTGIPIAAGQRLGMSRFSGTAGQGAQIWTALGGAMPGATLRTASAHDTGTVNYAFSNANTEALFQYVIQADADGDGFGDETQDLCVGTAGTDGGCAPIPARATPAKAKKCKKKKKKKRAVPAKKCKKKAKKK